MTPEIAEFAAGVAASDLAQSLKFSRWGYSLANAGHVLGVALLVGGILPLDLRLLGLWGRLDRTDAVKLLAPTAAFGLLLAVCTGALLFSVRAGHYVEVTLLYVKLCLITLGATLALILHIRAGLWIERATPRLAALHGGASLVLWLGALLCGRMIAYFPY